MSQNITVCFATDDNYAQHAAAAIASLLLNTRTQRSIDIYILTNGNLSEQNTSRLSGLERLNPHCHIHFLSVDPSIFSSVPFGNWGVEICFRIAVPDLLPNVDRLVYVDCDTIVMGDIEYLFDVDMEGCVMAAVKDATASYCAARLGLSSDAFVYCNSGVIVMDTKQMRDRGFDRLFFKYAEELKDLITLPDQDLINVVVSRDFGAFKMLDSSWNISPVKAKSLPNIIHYIRVAKPWEYGVDYRYKSLYWDYLAKTEYVDALAKYARENMAHSSPKAKLCALFSRYILSKEINRKGDVMRIKLFRMSVFKRVKKGDRSTNYLLGVKLPF